jgi:hypothetical protein
VLYRRFKVATAVTLRHGPSGISVTVQDSRSQAINRKLARGRLLDAIDHKLNAPITQSWSAPGSCWNLFDCHASGSLTQVPGSFQSHCGSIQFFRRWPVWQLVLCRLNQPLKMYRFPCRSRCAFTKWDNLFSAGNFKQCAQSAGGLARTINVMRCRDTNVGVTQKILRSS